MNFPVFCFLIAVLAAVSTFYVCPISEMNIFGFKVGKSHIARRMRIAKMNYPAVPRNYLGTRLLSLKLGLLVSVIILVLQKEFPPPLAWEGRVSEAVGPTCPGPAS